MSHKFASSFVIIILVKFMVILAMTLPSATMITFYPPKSFVVEIEHIGSRSNLTKIQMLGLAIISNGHRKSAMAPSPYPDSESPVLQAKGEFIMNLSIGTPPRQFSAIMDTGSSLVWTQCKPCNTCYAQPTPIFDPNTSSSFSPVSCSSDVCALRGKFCENGLCKYTAVYGDGSFSFGNLATETFTLGNSIGNATLPNIAFGCGNNNGGLGLNNVAGLVGLGRGPLSLVSQLKPKRFSYCLPRLGEDKKGTLSFGTLADKDRLIASNSTGTPILTNPRVPSLYFVSLEGISLDDTLLAIPKSVFEISMNGSGGVFLDSGTALTYLYRDAYWILRREFAARTRLPVVSTLFVDLDLCFRMPPGGNVSSISFPKMKFHFKNAVLELPQENYMIEIGTRLVCLGMLPGFRTTIFGSLMQQNILILHDLENQIISFYPNQCA